MQGVANSRRGKSRMIYYLTLLVFSGVLYVGIYMGGYSLTQLNKFYEKKVQELNGATISAYLPANQDYNRVLGILGAVEEVDLVGSRKSFYIENVTLIFNNETVESNVLIQNANEVSTLLTHHISIRGDAGDSNTIDLPYLFHSHYHLNLGDSVTISLGTNSKTYTVNGFYEDSIYANYKISEVVQIFMHENTMKALTATFQEGSEYVTIYGSTEEITATNEAMEEFTKHLQQDIFVGGLSLSGFTSSQVENNIAIYIKIVQIVWIIIGILMILISLGLLGYLWTKILRKQSEEYKSIGKGNEGLIITYIISIVVNGVIGLFILPKLLQYQIRLTGFKLISQNTFMFYIFSLIVYLLFTITGFLISYLFSFNKRNIGHKKDASQQREIRKVAGKTAFAITFKGQSVFLFFITFLLTFILMLSTKVFDHTIVNPTQLNQWLRSEETMEVFEQNNEYEEEVTDILLEEIHQLSSIISSFYTAILGFVLLTFILILLLSLESRIEQLRHTIFSNSKKHYVLPMLSSLLVCMIPAMLIGFAASEILSNIAVKRAFTTFGFTPYQFPMNIGYFLIMIFGILVITSGITLLVMKDKKIINNKN